MIADLDAFLDDVGQSAYGWPDSLRFTYDKTRELLAAGIPGDLVECGTAAGVHPAVMARACIDAGEQRTIRLFDSFRGLPNGGEHDQDWNQAHPSDGKGTLEPVGMCVCSTRDVDENLRRWVPDYPAGLLRYHVGWFQGTVEQHARSDEAALIAFLRLDGDLYESTRVCLEHLYPLCSPGATIVCDDLNLDGCRAAVRDYGLDPDAFEPITASGDGWMRKP